jgi:hypothetical protein
MIFKYFSRAWVLALSLLLLSSCLNSSDENVEYSPDAQIYAFSMSSASDTAGLLSATKFTIDQVNGKIFNKEPLPFQFQVDSVLLSITGFSTYSPFTMVLLKFDSGTTSYWIPSDSVAVHSLKQIITTAADGITQKPYDFTLNIYEQDPYVISWNQRNTGYLPTSVVSQKTIAFQNRFITYYKSDSAIDAMFTNASDGTIWSDANITGLPPTLQLSSLVTANNAAFGLDITTDAVYKSTDGVNWSPVSTQYPVKAIYGELPLATNGNILAAVEINGELTFVETNDFTVLNPLNKLPAGLPVKDFSVTKVDASTSYSIKYIILSGGTTIENLPNNDIWILEEKDGKITYILSRKPATVSVSGSSLFFYDEKPYLMITSSGKNILMYSENYGLDWVAAAQNQSFPPGFDQRTNASIITDAENFIWIFGGISVTQGQLSDVWRGRLNKFAGI